MKKKKRNGGFTLIELLAVIIILGILMLIAIPSVTEYISSTRKKIYIATANKYIDAALYKVNSFEIPITDTEAMYYIPYNCIKLEKGGQSPYGNWEEAYVVVTMDDDKYNYYWTSIDSAGYGVPITAANDLAPSLVKPNKGTEISKTIIKDEKTIMTIFNSNDCTTIEEEPIGEVISTLPAIKRAAMNDDYFFSGTLLRSQIKEITFADSINIPAGSQYKSWDISEKEDGSVMAWYDSTTAPYSLTIGGDGGVSANLRSDYLFTNLTNATTINLLHFDTTNARNMNSMFQNCTNLTNLNISKFNTQYASDMQYMFSGLQNLTTLNISSLRTANVKTMANMFSNTPKLTSLDLSKFNTSKVTNMGQMFQASGVTSLKLTGWDTSNVTEMANMFYGVNKLTSLDVSSFNTLKVVNMNYMFLNMSSLKKLNLSNFRTPNVTKMGGMFSGDGELEELNVSNFDTSNITDMSAMFSEMPKLKSLDLSSFDTSKAQSMAFMFRNCSSLTSLNVSNFNTSNVIDMSVMFYGVSKVNDLDLSSFETPKVTNTSNMFYGTKFDTLNLKNADFSNVTGTPINMFAVLTKDVRIFVKNQAAIDFINSLGYPHAKPEIF